MYTIAKQIFINIAIELRQGKNKFATYYFVICLKLN